MKWFFTWLDRKLNDVHEDKYALEPSASCEDDIPYAELASCNGITLKIYFASGGWVVHTRMYDEKKDELIHQLHVVNHDKNLGEELARILTFKLM